MRKLIGIAMLWSISGGFTALNLWEFGLKQTLISYGAALGFASYVGIALYLACTARSANERN